MRILRSFFKLKYIRTLVQLGSHAASAENNYTHDSAIRSSDFDEVNFPQAGEVS